MTRYMIYSRFLQMSDCWGMGDGGGGGGSGGSGKQGTFDFAKGSVQGPPPRGLKRRVVQTEGGADRRDRRWCKRGGGRRGADGRAGRRAGGPRADGRRATGGCGRASGRAAGDVAKGAAGADADWGETDFLIVRSVSRWGRLRGAFSLCCLPLLLCCVFPVTTQPTNPPRNSTS